MRRQLTILAATLMAALAIGGVADADGPTVLTNNSTTDYPVWRSGYEVDFVVIHGGTTSEVYGAWPLEDPVDFVKMHGQWFKLNGLYSEHVIGPDANGIDRVYYKDPIGLGTYNLVPIWTGTNPENWSAQQWIDLNYQYAWGCDPGTGPGYPTAPPTGTPPGPGPIPDPDPGDPEDPEDPPLPPAP